jgi:hypothetical protein
VSLVGASATAPEQPFGLAVHESSGDCFVIVMQTAPIRNENREPGVARLGPTGGVFIAAHQKARNVLSADLLGAGSVKKP